MPLIEGLGDEVTFVLGGFCICIILTLAWFSTHTADIPLLREVGVIVVELSQRRSRTRNHITGERSDENVNSARIEGRNVVEEEAPVSHEDQQGSDAGSLLGENSSSHDRAEELKLERDRSLFATVNSTADSAASSHHETRENAATDEYTLLSSASQIREENAMPGQGEDISDQLIPTASVTVEDNNIFASSLGAGHPTEEDIRQRRVQYFQKSGTPRSIGSEENKNETSGLSEQSDRAESLSQGNINITHQPVLDSTDNLRGASQEDISDSQKLTSSKDSTSLCQENQASYSPESRQVETSASLRIRVKLKYMNETQRLVYASPYDTIGDFRRNHFQSELEDNRRVRFIYNGQDLQDDARTLQACNVGDNCTMHCLITAQTRQNSAGEAAHEEEDDSFMGALMYPLFTVVLVIVWYFRFTYRQYFSAMSTVCLIGMSFLLALSYISSLRSPDRGTEQQRARQTGTTGSQRPEPHQHAD